jgi:hypothetical protein
MMNAQKRMTTEEADAFAKKFMDDVNALFLARSMDGKLLDTIQNSIMQKVLLFEAGYLEAMRKSGFEAAHALGRLDPRLADYLLRETSEEVYEIYTEGFNHGVRTADQNRAEISANVLQFYEAYEARNIIPRRETKEERK